MKKGGKVRVPNRITKKYYESLMVRVRFLQSMKDSLMRLVEKSTSTLKKDAPSNEVEEFLNTWKRKYKEQFPGAKDARLAKAFVDGVNNENVISLKSSLDRFGIDLPKLLRGENLTDYLRVSVKNNVSLIKSIPSEHFASVEKTVLNGFVNGWTSKDIAMELTKSNEKLTSRATLIARDQVASINAGLTKQRYQKIGITKAMWSTSNDERVRESHREANGKIFDVEKGLLIDGEYVQAGEPINCRCVSIPIIDENMIEED